MQVCFHEYDIVEYIHFLAKPVTGQQGRVCVRARSRVKPFRSDIPGVGSIM